MIAASPPARPTPAAGPPEPAVRLEDLSLWLATGRRLLTGIRLEIRPGEHWALLGPNGAGKSTLLSVLAALRHPSSGRAEVLGATLGSTDLRELRRRIGLAGPQSRVPAELTLWEYVLTGASQTVQPLTQGYGAAERDRADELVGLVGLERLRDQPVGSCSTGERGRAGIARALMPLPGLLVMDEPAAALDLPSREDFRETMRAVALADTELASVTSAHHLEELPDTVTHVLLLRDGEQVATGGVALLADGEALSACFGRRVTSYQVDGRWHARAEAPQPDRA